MFRRNRRNPKPVPPEHGRPGRRRRERRRPRSLWIYLLAFIGLAAILFLVIKYLIIPLLVLAA